jgi:hypothetical protein
MDEVGVARAIRRRDHDVRLRDGHRVHDLRQHEGQAGAHQHAELTAGHPSARVEILCLLMMILIAHICSAPCRREARQPQPA